MIKQYWQFALSYAWRNLGRNRRRAVLTLFTVGFALGISLVAARYAEAVIQLWKDAAANTGTAHLQVHKQGYWERQEGIDGELLLEDNSAFDQEDLPGPKVSALAKRLKFEGLAATDDMTTHFVGIAVEPARESIVSPELFYPGYDKGEFVKNTPVDTVAIGRGLASVLGLELGDDMTLLAQTGQGSVNAIDARVVGIIDVPLPGFSKRAVYLHLEHARRLLRLPNQSTEYAIRLADGSRIEEWLSANQATAAVAGLDIRAWWDIDPLISKIEQIWDAVSSLLCALLLISAAMTVVNVIFMMVQERTVEIGTLKALGAKNKQIAVLFGVEGAVLGLVGGSIGLIVANIIVFIMNQTGIPFDSPFGGGHVIVHPTISWSWNLMWSLIAILGCALCSVPPARKAASVEPVVAFRNQI